MATLGKEEGFYAVVLETKHQCLVCQRAALHRDWSITRASFCLVQNRCAGPMQTELEGSIPAAADSCWERKKGKCSMDDEEDAEGRS